MIDNILIGGHEAEMAALEEIERVDGSWEPTENLFGEVPTIEQAIEQACERALDEVERCLHHLMSKET